MSHGVEIPDRERGCAGSSLSWGPPPCPSALPAVRDWSHEHRCQGPLLRGRAIPRLWARHTLAKVSSIGNTEGSRTEIEAEFLLSARCFSEYVKTRSQLSGEGREAGPIQFPSTPRHTPRHASPSPGPLSETEGRGDKAHTKGANSSVERVTEEPSVA